MKKILYYLKNLIISGFVLYGYNLIAVNFNMIIPINVFTILGSPALIALVLFKILML